MSITVSWEEFDKLVSKLTNEVRLDGPPELIVGLQRGGLIPSVALAHKLNIRDFLAIDIRRTVSDEIDGDKIAPVIRGFSQESSVAHKDVLIVDDVAGTGYTLRVIQQLLSNCSPRRLRSLVCFLNREKWDSSNTPASSSAISYIGRQVKGWVIFPWENSQ